MNNKKKTFLITLSLILVLGLGVLGAYAFFTDTTNVKENIFTVGKVELTLDETDFDDSTPEADRDISNTYKMIPGVTLAKDPTVTVKAGSNDCWVFVEVTDEAKEYNGTTYKASDFLTYSITTQTDGVSKWNKLEVENKDVYFCKVTNIVNDISLTVLDNNEVVVKDTVTETMMNDLIAADGEPNLLFKAYAFQLQKGDTNSDGVVEAFTALEAWQQLNP